MVKVKKLISRGNNIVVLLLMMLLLGRTWEMNVFNLFYWSRYL